MPANTVRVVIGDTTGDLLHPGPDGLEKDQNRYLCLVERAYILFARCFLVGFECQMGDG